MQKKCEAAATRHKAEDYTFRVFPSDDGNGFISVVAEFKGGLSNVGPTIQEAVEGMVDLLRFVLDDMYKSGEVPPEPFSAKTYSGRYALRMTPEQHRRIAMESAEQGVSINQLLVSRI